jgi:hypothetical protein
MTMIYNSLVNLMQHKLSEIFFVASIGNAGQHRCELVLLSFSFSERKEIISLVQQTNTELLSTYY